MKSLRLLLARAAAVVILVGINAVGASDQQTETALQNSAEKWPIVLAQNADAKEKGNKTAKVNGDRKGVILKGYDAVAYFTQGKPVKGNLEARLGLHSETRYYRLTRGMKKAKRATFS
jgi:hypothetical protein